MSDSYCTRTVGAKPATQQQCNTHSCADCRYQLNVSYWESRETQLITAFPAFVMWEGNLAAAIATDDNANWNITQLSANGYLYTSGKPLWYNDYEWIYAICRQPV